MNEPLTSIDTLPSSRSLTDANLPQWLIAFSPDGREFVIHLHAPRFFVEAKATDYRKWKTSLGHFESNGSVRTNQELDELLQQACRFYISEIYGLES